jgi:hypothetical protein
MKTTLNLMLWFVLFFMLDIPFLLSLFCDFYIYAIIILCSDTHTFFSCQYMPSETVDGYRYPSHGTGRLHRDGQPLPREDDNFIECMYFIQWDQEFVSFQDQGWIDFRSAANIGDESLLVMKVERMQG